MNTRPRHSLVAALTVVVAVSLYSAARSQAPSGGGGGGGAAVPAAEDRTEIKVYDVRDMLQTIQDHTIESSALTPPTHLPYERGAAGQAPRGGRFVGGGGVFGGGGNATAGKHPSAEDVADEILTLIKETVDPDSWVDNGGKNGQLRFLSGQIVVTQTAANHRQIQQILAQLRQTSAQMVTIDAHWVLLEPAQAQAVLKPAAGAGGDGKPAPGQLREVDLSALEKLGDVVRYRARTTGFNGQTVFITSGPARTVVYDLEAVAGDQAALYSPKTALLHTGALLQVRPLLHPELPRVTLDLQSVVSEFVDDSARGGRPAVVPTTMPARASAALGEALDRLNLRVQQLQTTLVIPADRPVLIGGMTLDPGTAGQDAKQLYLIIEATVTR